MDNSQRRGNARWVLGFIPLLVSLFVCSCNIEAGAAAGVQHQVGGTPGWSLPSRANVNYTTWASTQTFKIGDTLYFNYSSDYHNVVEVTKTNYESCNASNPIAEWTSGADKIPLSSSRTFYYICGIPGHCEEDQKVAVQVTGVRHQVGGSPGWSLPSLSNVNYTDWANTQTFSVGDTLYFNYSSAYHNVLQVTKVAYDTCNASDPIRQWVDGATTIDLNATGTFYYICGFPGHCEAGQKVAVAVGALSTTSGPAAAPTGSGGSEAPGPASSSTRWQPISSFCGLLALSLIMISVGLPYHSA